MPELPEVETVRRGLQQFLKDKPAIEKIEWKGLKLRFNIPKKLSETLSGQKIQNIERRSKYLLIQTEYHTLLSHLGMTGSWRMDQAQLIKHDHLIIYFKDGRRLIYNDPRRFGFVDLLKRGEEESSRWLKILGPEPLSENFNADYLLQKRKNKSVSMKTFVMDAKVVVGVGNIYASEALFLAKINPKKKASKLKEEEAKRLVQSIRQVLQSAIQAGGTTFRDFKNAEGNLGYFQVALKVYERSGEKCCVCKSTIQKFRQGGRSTYWCRQCQK